MVPLENALWQFNANSNAGQEFFSNGAIQKIDLSTQPGVSGLD